MLHKLRRVGLSWQSWPVVGGRRAALTCLPCASPLYSTWLSAVPVIGAPAGAALSLMFAFDALYCSRMMSVWRSALRTASMQAEGVFKVLEEVAATGRISAQRRARLVMERLQELPLLE